MTEVALIKLSEVDAQAFIEAIERREITLEAEGSLAVVYAGNCYYQASNGWQLVVFNDCGEFDYIDSITTDDGRMIQSFYVDYGSDPQCAADEEGFVQSYTGPTDARECYRLYGIPPYLAHPVDHVWTSTMPVGSPIEFYRSPKAQQMVDKLKQDGMEFNW